MPEAAYSVSYPGLQITRCDFLFTHGIDPSVAVVHGIATVPPTATGDLVFMNFGQPIMTFRQCALDPTTVSNPLVRRGFRMRFNICDRRWTWRHKLVSGRYNVRATDATIIPSTKKTYREILEILLKALGETNFTIKIPNEDLEPPETIWYEQRADLQLAWLCDRIGCLITLGLDDVVSIIPNGEGPTYPANGLEFSSILDTTPSAWPKKVYATYAPTRFQMKIKLEAVGLDRDGSVKPINSLSYSPGNWSLQVPGIYNDVASEDDRELARETVYRWYRIKEFAGAGIKLPKREYGISSINDIVLLNEVVKKTSNEYPRRPYLEGRFFNSDLTGLNEQEGEFSYWDDEFELDLEQGIVKFPYPVFKVSDVGHHDPAELYLTCAFNARKNPTSGLWGRNVEYVMASSPGAEGNIVQVEEPDVFHYVIQEYTDDSPTKVVENLNLINEQGDMLARSYAKHWEAIPQMSVQWNGIIPYPVTGNIHQMRWRIGGGAPVTWGGKNVEYRYMSPSVNERRLRHEAARSHHL